MEVCILLIGRYFTLAGPAKPIRVARPKAVDLESIKIKNGNVRSFAMNGYSYSHDCRLSGMPFWITILFPIYKKKSAFF